jgi:predicted RNA binding protein YcfA (HicA-like mRNA interferase family)
VKLPRDLSGDGLAETLSRLGYEAIRQTGSHACLKTTRGGLHKITIPRHRRLKVGTLSAILKDVAEHAKLDYAALLELLFS